MNKNIFWPWAIKNSICIICWTILAIVFDNWLLALLGGLFITSIKTEDMKYYYRYCDKCGKHSPYAKSYNEAIDKAKAAGWIIRKIGDKWDDRCPECQDDL